MKAFLLTCAGLLIFALADLPIGYYTFLRIVVTMGAVGVIISEYDGEITPWIIIFGIIGIIFNPFIPIYLHDREAWAFIDISCAVIFGFKALQLRKGKD